MLHRFLGTTGLKVSRLGLGTMTWGTDTDEHEAADQLRLFVEAGGTLVDTAASYGQGSTERLLGSLLGTVVDRGDIVLATKGGITRRDGDRMVDLSRGALLRNLDTSLERLGVDYVDLWQAHAWSDDVPLEETLSALDYAVSVRAGPLRRRLELRRVADRPGRHLPDVGTRAEPGSPRPRSSTRSSSAASSARSCRPHWR